MFSYKPISIGLFYDELSGCVKYEWFWCRDKGPQEESLQAVSGVHTDPDLSGTSRAPDRTLPGCQHQSAGSHQTLLVHQLKKVYDEIPMIFHSLFHVIVTSPIFYP